VGTKKADSVHYNMGSWLLWQVKDIPDCGALIVVVEAIEGRYQTL